MSLLATVVGAPRHIVLKSQSANRLVHSWDAATLGLPPPATTGGNWQTALLCIRDAVGCNDDAAVRSHCWAAFRDMPASHIVPVADRLAMCMVRAGTNEAALSNVLRSIYDNGSAVYAPLAFAETRNTAAAEAFCQAVARYGQVKPVLAMQVLMARHLRSNDLPAAVGVATAELAAGQQHPNAETFHATYRAALGQLACHAGGKWKNLLYAFTTVNFSPPCVVSILGRMTNGHSRQWREALSQFAQYAALQAPMLPRAEEVTPRVPTPPQAPAPPAPFSSRVQRLRRTARKTELLSSIMPSMSASGDLQGCLDTAREILLSCRASSEPPSLGGACMEMLVQCVDRNRDVKQAAQKVLGWMRRSDMSIFITDVPHIAAVLSLWIRADGSVLEVDVLPVLEVLHRSAEGRRCLQTFCASAVERLLRAATFPPETLQRVHDLLFEGAGEALRLKVTDLSAIDRQSILASLLRAIPGASPPWSVLRTTEVFVALDSIELPMPASAVTALLEMWKRHFSEAPDIANAGRRLAQHVYSSRRATTWIDGQLLAFYTLKASPAAWDVAMALVSKVHSVRNRREQTAELRSTLATSIIRASMASGAWSATLSFVHRTCLQPATVRISNPDAHLIGSAYKASLVPSPTHWLGALSLFRWALDQDALECRWSSDVAPLVSPTAVRDVLYCIAGSDLPADRRGDLALQAFACARAAWPDLSDRPIVMAAFVKAAALRRPCDVGSSWQQAAALFDSLTPDLHSRLVRCPDGGRDQAPSPPFQSCLSHVRDPDAYHLCSALLWARCQQEPGTEVDSRQWTWQAHVAEEGLVEVAVAAATRAGIARPWWLLRALAVKGRIPPPPGAVTHTPLMPACRLPQD